MSKHSEVDDQGLDNKVQNEGSKPDVLKMEPGEKSQLELMQEKGKELDESMKKSDGSIKYAKPGRSDILP
jgi:hypothetical protein